MGSTMLRNSIVPTVVLGSSGVKKMVPGTDNSDRIHACV